MRSAAEKVLDRLVTATVDGERRRVPLTEALVLQLAQKALSGDHRASREILRIADQIEAASLAERISNAGVFQPSGNRSPKRDLYERNRLGRSKAFTPKSSDRYSCFPWPASLGLPT